jgi:hypothetical protein
MANQPAIAATAFGCFAVVPSNSQIRFLRSFGDSAPNEWPLRGRRSEKPRKPEAVTCIRRNTLKQAASAKIDNFGRCCFRKRLRKLRESLDDEIKAVGSANIPMSISLWQ